MGSTNRHGDADDKQGNERNIFQRTCSACISAFESKSEVINSECKYISGKNDNRNLFYFNAEKKTQLN
jgi:hypothetical protein